jgi:uncharacterized protein YceK
MLRLLILIALLLTAGCATTRKYVNCENAHKVRAAAVDTIAAIDFACPLPPPPAADSAPDPVQQPS